MTGLADIGVTVEQAGCATPDSRGNALPLLHEIRHALDRLLASGEPTAIDLNSLPMGPGDERRLFAALGEGEVRAELDALGRTLIRETRYPGVWITEHFNASGEVVGRLLEVTWVPAILQSQAEDVSAGLATLTRSLATTDGH